MRIIGCDLHARQQHLCSSVFSPPEEWFRRDTPYARKGPALAFYS
jgi:hypothetical protein